MIICSLYHLLVLASGKVRPKSLWSIPGVIEAARPIQIYIILLSCIFNKPLGIIMESFKIEMGDIVALMSHPYLENHQNIIISGDTLQQSPLMVVSEKLVPKDTREEGSENNKVEPIQYKCVWFSTKNQKFEEAWILGTSLKLIQKQKEPNGEIPSIGSQVIFKTAFLEIKKRKSSFFSEITSKEVGKIATSITPLLSYVSPILLVNGFKDDEKKEQENSRRIKFPTLIKLHWFNNPSDKISEAFLPLCCLEKVTEVDNKILDDFNQAIRTNKFIKANIDDSVSFLKPLSISFLNGNYFLNAIDFIKNEVINHWQLNEIEILDTVDSPVIESAPEFNFSKSRIPSKSILDLLRKAKRGKKIVKIKYLNQYGIISVRCIKGISLHKVIEKGQATRYLNGFCMSKMDQRHFNVERIIQVELINLKSSDVIIK